MSAGLKRVEVWTELACNSGLRTAVLPLASAKGVDEIVGLLISHKLVLQVATVWSAIAELVERRVIRVEYVDDTFDEYRITQIESSAGRDSLTTVTCLGIEYDLGRRALIYQTVNQVPEFKFTVAGLTPTQHLTTYVDANLPALWAVGTVTPTAAVAVEADNDTPLSYALRVASAAGLADGLTYEVSVRRNGTSGYYIDLTEYNASLDTVDVRPGKNLLSLNLNSSTDGQANRIFPRGSDGGGMGDAYFEVTAVVANTYITIADINGSAVGAIFADDQFNTGFSWLHGDGVEHDITDTDQANQRLYMASTTGIAVGEWGRIVFTGGDQVPYVDDAAAQASNPDGILVGVLQVPSPTHTNFITNPDFGDWSGTDPVDWTRTSSAATKATTAGYYITGGQSAKFAYGTGTRLEQIPSLYCTALDTFTVTFWIYITIFSSEGGVRIVRLSPFFEEFVPFDGTVPGLDKLNTWLAFSKTYAAETAGAKSLRLTFMNNTFGTALSEFYLDAVQVVFGSGAKPFVKGSGGATLQLNANQYLVNNTGPAKSYAVEMRDLYRVDATGAGQFDRLRLGQNVRMTAAEIGV